MGERRQRLLEGINDNRYLEAVALVLRTRCARAPHLQIHLGIGHPYARWLQKAMVEDGVLSHPDEAGRHRVLLPAPH